MFPLRYQALILDLTPRLTLDLILKSLTHPTVFLPTEFGDHHFAGSRHAYHLVLLNMQIVISCLCLSNSLTHFYLDYYRICGHPALIPSLLIIIYLALVRGIQLPLMTFKTLCLTQTFQDHHK